MSKILFLILFSSINSWAIKVLHIGNSHSVGSFGDSLYSEFKKNKTVSAIRSIGLAGASGKHYAAENEKDRTLSYGYVDRPKISVLPSGTVPKLSTLLNQVTPDMLIIELADNFADYKSAKPDGAYAKQEIQKIINQIKQSKKKPKECFWIGPNWTDKENTKTHKKTNTKAASVAKIIESEIKGHCTFVNSMNIIKKSEAVTTSDGLHFGQTSGKLWGKRTYEEIIKKSNLFQAPAKNTPSTNKIKSNGSVH